jgi:hypothetical protein
MSQPTAAARRTAAVLALVAAGAIAPAAHAAPAKLTGGTTTIALRPAVTSAVAKAGVTVSVVAPATAGADGSYSFPVAGGRVNQKLRGVVRHQGGLVLTRGERKVTLRSFVIVSAKRAFLTAKAGGKRLRLARLTGATRSTQDGKAAVTAKLRLTQGGAAFLNKRSKRRTFRAGLVLGTATVVATTQDASPTT